MKKNYLFIALFVASVAISCTSYHYETVSQDPLGTKIYKLENGLEVYMSVNKETPRIQTYIAVKVGAKNDPLETTGLAHYFEHLMFKGTPNFGTSDYAAEKPLLDEIEMLFEEYRVTTDELERKAIYHKIDSISYLASKISIPNEYDKLMTVIGAQGTNAWTSQDETVYTEDIPSNQIENWARIQADRFRNPVLRGFHTELETIYEEKNMSLTQDLRKLWTAIDELLFPNHPYGMHDVLGFQEHLKNPSISNVKKYHETYYVPNNIRICLSGDFDPDEMVATIEKYFGDWKPNPDIPTLEYTQEEPITSPKEKSVYGLEAEIVALAWRLPAASDLRNSAIANIANLVLSNGKAGILDIDVNQKHKTQGVGTLCSMQPDYSSFMMLGYPKSNQSLDDVKSILLENLAKLRKGDFDEELLEATVNNLRLWAMQDFEDNSSRARKYVDAFINGVEWKEACNEIELYSSITKEELVKWANEYLADNNYVVVYKRQGVDNTVQKISAPSITPIETNRDKESAFLQEIKETVVKPIEPVHVDFERDMSQFDLAENVNVLYKKNEINGIGYIDISFDRGYEDMPLLPIAADYVEYLGTETMSAEEISKKLFELAVDHSIRIDPNTSSIQVFGLDENLPEALKIIESLVCSAKADEQVLANVKAEKLKSRANAKLSQRSCYNALTKYVMFGAVFVKNTTLSNKEVLELKSEELLSALSSLFDYSHEIMYFGPSSKEELCIALDQNHNLKDNLKLLNKKFRNLVQTPESKVVIANYDAKQIYYLQYSNRGETFNPSAEASIRMYNEYFGGGMNSIVFQEMREARGLAYSAWASLEEPDNKDGNYSFNAFIATQNDKMQTAIEAFDEIINNMPESEQAFEIAKEGLISNLRTRRVKGVSVLTYYTSCRNKGLTVAPDREIYEKVQGLKLEGVKQTQKEWVKNRCYNYAILGDVKDLDMNYLKTLGEVEIVSLEEIFGY